LYNIKEYFLIEKRLIIMATFLMLVGLPGSGKSTYAQKFLDVGYKIHSSDAIREELTGSMESQEVNGAVFNLLHKRVKEDLLNGNNVIYDATNINWKRRKAFLNELSKIKCEKVCHVIATPIEECVNRNNLRDRKVPFHVIAKMYTNFDIPYYNEGWDVINIVYNKESYKSFYGQWTQFAIDMLDYDQDNEHHSLTLGKHCDSCYRYVKNAVDTSYKANEELIIAAALHDCGKPATRTYINKNGKTTEQAHYYEHEHVGCYNAMFYDLQSDIDRLTICALIR
jgi:predicted kinase